LNFGDGPADDQEPERVDGVLHDLVAAADGEGEAAAANFIRKI
jgi:hypothetical protein